MAGTQGDGGWGGMEGDEVRDPWWSEMEKDAKGHVEIGRYHSRTGELGRCSSEQHRVGHTSFENTDVFLYH